VTSLRSGVVVRDTTKASTSETTVAMTVPPPERITEFLSVS
jgi:hypothetical protein